MPAGDRVHANGCAHAMSGHCFCPETYWRKLPAWLFQEMMEKIGYASTIPSVGMPFDEINFLEMRHPQGGRYVAPMGTRVPPRAMRPRPPWVRLALKEEEDGISEGQQV